MKTLLSTLILVLNLAFYPQATFADSGKDYTPGNEADINIQKTTPYINMNVGVEINGLEAAAVQAAEGLTLIGESLRDIADHPEISPERQKQIEQSLSRINELSQSLTVSVNQLPIMVEKSIAPVVEVSNQLSAEIKQIIIIASFALILLILIALLAVYYFVLAPSTQAVIKTTRLLGELADTLESTANIVEISSERNLQIMEEVQKMHKQAN